MLIQKYKPKRIGDIVGQKYVIKKVYDWLEKWKSGKALLMYGATGIGKTIIVEVIANEKNMNLIEINASDKDAASNIKSTLIPASKEGSLYRKRLIIIDEIDSFSSSDRGGIAEIIKIIKESRYPIILTANNAYNPKLRTLRNYCELLRVKKIPVNLIEIKLNEIASKEKLKTSKELIRKMAINSDGDIRSAINDIESLSKDTELPMREREKNIFEVLGLIFRGKDLGKISKAVDQCDKDIDEIFWWVEQNIPKEFENPKKISEAFELLSKADLFRSRITTNQNYRFKKYMKDIIIGISSINTEPPKKFILYKPPERLILLGQTKSSRREADELYKSLGETLHCSKRKIKEQLPYLNMILNNPMNK